MADFLLYEKSEKDSFHTSKLRNTIVLKVLKSWEKFALWNIRGLFTLIFGMSWFAYKLNLLKNIIKKGTTYV